MPLQIIYPQQDDRGLQDLLVLANIYDIYDKAKQREFDKLYALASTAGGPQEQYELYDKMTGISDWLFNTPLYQKKKHYEELIDRANQFKENAAALSNPQKLGVPNMVDIANKIENINKEYEQINPKDLAKAGGYAKALGYLNKDERAKVQAVSDKLANIKNKKKDVVFNDVRNDKEFISELLGMELPDNYQQNTELIKQAEEAFNKYKVLAKDFSSASNIYSKQLEKQYNKKYLDTQKQAEIEEAAKPISDMQEQYRQKQIEFTQALEQDPTVILGLPEEDRNFYINKYYETQLALTGNQVLAADRANALLKAINPRLNKPVPYYDYLKSKDDKGGPGGLYKVYTGRGATIPISYNDAANISDALQALNVNLDVVKEGTTPQKDVEHLELENDAKLKDAFTGIVGSWKSFWTWDKNERAKIINTRSDKLQNANMMLEKKGSPYRIFIETGDGKLYPTIIKADEYNRRINALKGMYQQKREINPNEMALQLKNTK